MASTPVSAPRPVPDAPAPTSTPAPARPAPAPGVPTVAVVGLGYVGLPTALGLRAAGRPVIGVDASPRRLSEVRAAAVDLPPAQRARLRAAVREPGLELTADLERLSAADAVVICVPTPVDAHQVPDLRALRATCAGVVARAVPGQTLILSSTSCVGTTRGLLLEPLAARGFEAGRDVFVACAPERIDPGAADAADAPEIPASSGSSASSGAANAANAARAPAAPGPAGAPSARPPRVVGGVSPECGRRAAEVLAPIASGLHLVTSPEAAEMAKLLENTFRAVNIALANEVADICGQLGLEAMEVAEAAATKPYGYLPFFPGPGAGGQCIPCDPHYLRWQLRGRRVPSPVVDAAMAALAARPAAVARRAREVLAEAGRPPRGARVLIVGAAYKPGVADTRESPAVALADALAAVGADVAYTDPLVPRLDVAGRRLSCTASPGEERWDLVVAVTVHPGQDLSWLHGQPLLLDATYRLDEFKHRHLV